MSPLVVVRTPLPEGALEPLSGRARLELLAEGAPRADLLRAIREADGLIAFLTDAIDQELFSLAPRLAVVANVAVGVNNVDLAAARKAGVVITNTPDVLTDATADCTMALILMVTRRLGEGERELRAGRFSGWTPTYLLGSGLQKKRLGIIGMGRIGRAVAKRARAFGVKVLGSDRHANDEILAQSDVVSLHVPLTDKTRHLIDEAALERMKPGSYLVNTSRGPVVDEAALARALASGRLAGAALDVFEEEPRVHPELLAAPNTVLVPHLGSNTREARLAMARLAAANVAAVLGGRKALTPVG